MGKRVRASDSGVRALALCVCVGSRARSALSSSSPQLSSNSHTFILIAQQSEMLYWAKGKRTLGGFFFLLFDCKQIPQELEELKVKKQNSFFSSNCADATRSARQSFLFLTPKTKLLVS
jgi:hypothetical protein